MEMVDGKWLQVQGAPVRCSSVIVRRASPTATRRPNELKPALVLRFHDG